MNSWSQGGELIEWIYDFIEGSKGNLFTSGDGCKKLTP